MIGAAEDVAGHDEGHYPQHHRIHKAAGLQPN